MSITDSPIKPEVSVLMSCYNGQEWLADAIESVLAQTYRNFEFIVIDDGSTDQTWAIIQRYAQQDARIVAHTKKNSGLADTLNVGLAMARGAWVARLDADDICEPQRLEKQVNFVRIHPDTMLLGTGFWEIDSRGAIIKRQTYPKSHRQLLRHLERAQRFFPHSSAFYHTETARNIGGYTVRFRYADDYRLWLDFSRVGKSSCIGEPLLKIRKHAGQMSLAGNGRRQAVDRTAAIICHYLCKNGLPDLARTKNDQKWQGFVAWVENSLTMRGYFHQHEIWTNARAQFFATANKFQGLLGFMTTIVRSGYAWTIVSEKVCGSALPRKLAREWQKTQMMKEWS